MPGKWVSLQSLVNGPSWAIALISLRFSDYVPKPLRRAELLAAIARQIASSRADAALTAASNSIIKVDTTETEPSTTTA